LRAHCGERLAEQMPAVEHVQRDGDVHRRHGPAILDREMTVASVRPP
jgi:hypothetical protein